MSKRKPLDSQAALAGAVDYLLREFRGLDLKPYTPPPGDDIEPFAGPIEVTYLVASATARPETRGVADFVCDGIEDNAEIEAALNLCGDAGGGRVQLSEGIFNIAISTARTSGQPEITMPADTSLVGVGAGTVLNIVSPSATNHHGIDMGARCEIANLKVDLSNTAAALTAFYQSFTAAVGASVRRCWFDGMGASGVGDLSYVSMYAGATVVDCYFNDVKKTGGTGANTGAVADWASIVGCTFVGDSTAEAIESFDTEPLLISSNVFSGGCKIQLNNSIGCSIVTNQFVGGANLAIKAFGVQALSIIGNLFDGTGTEADDYIQIMAGPIGVLIDGNMFREGSVQFLGETNVEGITITNNRWQEGGQIHSDAAAANWRTTSVLIAGNNMDSRFNTGSARIAITGTSRIVQDLAIVDNILSDSGGAIAGSDPLIEVRFQDTVIDENGRSIRIVGNKIADNRSAVLAGLAIRVIGPSDKEDGGVDVSGNHIEASDGVDIQYVRDLTFKGNRLDIEDTAANQTRYAGQVKIANCGTAVVDENAIVAGEDGDKAGTTAVIYVETTDGGSVRNNDVWGVVSGAMDTALIVDGPSYVFGNAYHGAHSLNAGTEFTP